MPFRAIELLLGAYSSGIWLAFLMVDCWALSLGGSLFSEVLRTSSLLEDLKNEFSARLACALWLGDVIQRLETYPAWS